jgi:hypothetical protein
MIHGVTAALCLDLPVIDPILFRDLSETLRIELSALLLPRQSFAQGPKIATSRRKSVTCGTVRLDQFWQSLHQRKREGPCHGQTSL